MLLLELALYWLVPAGVVLVGWAVRGLLRRRGREVWWLPGWLVGAAALVLLAMLAYQVCWGVANGFPTQRGSGFETGAQARRQLIFLVSSTLAWTGLLGTSAAWLWLTPRLDWRRLHPAWWGLVAVVGLITAVAAWQLHCYGPAGRQTPRFWNAYGFMCYFEQGRLRSLRRSPYLGGASARPMRDAFPLLVGEEYLEEVDLAGGIEQVDDEALRYLARLPKLRKLNLISCRRITDAGIEHLRGHPSLEELDLGGTAVTDACIPALLSMPQLREVRRPESMSVEGSNRLHRTLRARKESPM